MSRSNCKSRASRVGLRIVVLALLAGVNAPSANANDDETLTGNINVFLGTKSLDEDDWSPAEDQRESGIDFDSRLTSMPVNLVLSLRWSEGQGQGVDPITFAPATATFTFTGRTAEYGVGVRKVVESLPIVRPYAGGGLALITYEGVITDLVVTDPTGAVVAVEPDAVETEAAAGIWVDGGFYFTLARHLNVGVQARYSLAPKKLLGLDLNSGPVTAGGLHLGLLAGYHF